MDSNIFGITVRNFSNWDFLRVILILMDQFLKFIIDLSNFFIAVKRRLT